MFNDYLNKSLALNKGYNIGGVKRIWLINRNDLVSIAKDVDQVVTGVTLTEGKEFSLFTFENGSYSYATELSKSGTLYVINIGFTIPKQELQKVMLLDSLLNTEVTAIIQDQNLHFWLIGNKLGLEASYEAAIDSDNNSYSVSLVGKQLNRVEEVSVKYMKTIPVAESIISHEIPQTNFEVILNPGGGSGGGVSGNKYSTVIVTLNNYIIQRNDIFLLVDPGLTIYLPAIPEEGQFHIIKSKLGAEASPVTIEGSGIVIDDSITASINTDNGGFEFLFAGGRWNCTAVVI